MKRTAILILALIMSANLWAEGSAEASSETEDVDTSVWSLLWEFENGFTICQDQDGFVVWHQDDEIAHTYTLGGWTLAEVRERHDLEDETVTYHKPKEYGVVCVWDDDE